jgi:toxin FitB
MDGLIAATALEHDLTIATRDKDFSGLGVLVFNPWATGPIAPQEI